MKIQKIIKHCGLVCGLAALAVLAACAAVPTVPPPPPIPPPAIIYPTSFSCNNGNTPVQNAVCDNARLAALDVQMAAILRQHLGSDNIFERDHVLATQRGWLLDLQDKCGVTSTQSGATDSCLTAAAQAQIAVLSNGPPPVQMQAGSGAIPDYVRYKLIDAKQPAFCSVLAGQAEAAMSADGSIDPARLPGAVEIAGSHGDAIGADPQGDGNITVDIFRADMFGGYQLRARGVSLPGAASPVLGPDSLGAYMETLPNGGGRFVAYASQTNDYGDIDVFAYQGQVIALLTDVIGYNSPAPPGEAAAAAAYILGQHAASPACMFETYITPPPIALGPFADRPALAPFLALIDAMNTNPSAQLAPSDRQDSAYFAQQTRWMLFNMPQLVLQQVLAGGWTGWLRARHDQVLDALYAWSQRSPANQAQFNRLFALIHPAAIDLDTIYVQQQGIKPDEAEQVTAIAMMELLYQSTLDISPNLGSGPANPADFTGYKPLYPILASPHS